MNNTYLILLENTEKKMTKDVIERNVRHLEALDVANKLIICGPFEDYPGGMLLVKCDSLNEAHELARMDHFVSEGYREYSIRTLEVACKENNFIL